MSNTVVEQEELEKAIKYFLLDIDCLNKVSPWINKFNVFNVLKIDSMEIRHSNMLGWLLDPNENHGLGDKVLLGLIKFIIKKLKKSTLSAYDLCQLLSNSYSFYVLREYNNIDILLVSNENKMVICIENKIYSSEHGNQLARYYDTVGTEYSDYKKFYLFLTLGGIPASMPETWVSISYADMNNIIEMACKNSELAPEVKFFINNYLEVIKGKTGMNDEIKRVCNEIYLKHKKALDFIYMNKSSETELIYQKLENWLAEHHTGIDNNSLWNDRGYIRFKSLYLTDLFPSVNNEKRAWKIDSLYYYQLHYVNNYFEFDLAFAYDFCFKENKQKIDDFLEKIGKPCEPSSWGYKICYLKQKKYAIDTFFKGDFKELIENIEAEEEMKRMLGKN